MRTQNTKTGAENTTAAQFVTKNITREEYLALNARSGRGRSRPRATCGGDDSYSVTFSSSGEVVDLFHWFGPTF
jgi:hypothetical protein